MSQNYTVSVDITATDKTGKATSAVKQGFNEAFNDIGQRAEKVAKAINEMRLGESLNKQSDVATISLANLDKALQSGSISIDTYTKAVGGIQDSFGLVSPASKDAAREMQRLQAALENGEISADDYQKELRQLASTLDKVDDEAKQAGRGLKGAFKEIGTGMMRFAGEQLANLAAQVPALVGEMTNLGIQSEAVGLRFERFSGGAERASMFLEAFNEGTLGTVDRLTAMGSASKLLQMGLVETGDEMGQMAAIATSLGDQTKSTGDRIADWAALLANQSIPRLDNFGISSGRVRQRIDELLKSGEALNREEAFKMAVMEEGAKALNTLGDVSGTAATKLAVLKAAAQDAKIGVGEMIVEMIGGAQGVEELASRLRALPETIRQVATMIGAVTDAQRVFVTTLSRKEAMAEFENSMKRGAAAMVDFRTESEELRYAHYGNTQALERESNAISSISYLSEEAAGAVDKHSRSQGEILHTILATTAALESETEAVDDFVGGMDAAAQLRLSMSWTTQLDQMAEKSADFAKKREEIEAEHQSKIAELRQRGAATAVRLDVTAEQEKLVALRRNLEIALQAQSEQTAKTALSTQMRKEDQISKLQEQVAAQEKLLDDYNSGRLVKAGENVTQLIALENQRKDAAIASLDEQMAKEQQLQEQALGRMTLEAFEQWAEQKDIPVERMLEMRTSIAEEFGLVSEGATELVNDMVDEWDRWAQDTGIATEDVVNYMGAVITETGKVDQALLALTAEEWVIKVRYDVSGKPPNPPGSPSFGPDDEDGFQHGGSFFVGETGPEIVTVQPINNNVHETVNIYGPHAGAAYEERRRRERALILGRTM